MRQRANTGSPRGALARKRGQVEKRLAELELSVDAEALGARGGRGTRPLRRGGGEAEREAAQRGAGLSRAVSAAMQQLAMAGGRFAIALEPLAEPGAAGAEAIEFQVASHPSLPLRPLAKVASGGELSRISLAIQLVAAKSSPVGTLVFDEVDSGMGGAVSETIGKSLRRLGRDRQVLCVTHLPQVAAQGDAQWTVAKASSEAGSPCGVAAGSRSAHRGVGAHAGRR